jgi:hypothetical protein
MVRTWIHEPPNFVDGSPFYFLIVECQWKHLLTQGAGRQTMRVKVKVRVRVRFFGGRNTAWLLEPMQYKMLGRPTFPIVKKRKHGIVALCVEDPLSQNKAKIDRWEKERTE